MTDPEIPKGPPRAQDVLEPQVLEAEEASARPAGTGPRSGQPSSTVERLLAAVQRALPGRAVRASVDDVPGRGARFSLEAEGDGGQLVVESGPFGTVLVRFGGARFTFALDATSPQSLDASCQSVAERVQALAEERLIVYSEQAGSALRRTVIVAVHGAPSSKGREFEAVIDTGIEPHSGDAHEPGRLHSFNGTYDREPTKGERRRLDKLQGGLVGKLKRKLFMKVVDKATSALKSALDPNAGSPRTVDEQNRITADDGGAGSESRRGG